MTIQSKMSAQFLNGHRFPREFMRHRSLLAAAAAALAAGVSGAAAADVLTHIPADTTVDTLQVLSAPGTADLHRLLNEGQLTAPASSGELMIEGSGAGRIVVDNLGSIGGLVDFSAVTGEVEFNIQEGGTWFATPPGFFVSNSLLVSRFGSGDDVIDNQGQVSLHGGIDFGAGLDVLDNRGSFSVSRTWGLEELNNSGDFNLTGDSQDADLRRVVNTGTFTISWEASSSTGDRAASLHAPNLERFENSGVINMVGQGGIVEYSNRLLLPGAEFVATGDSQLRVNAFFGDVPQNACVDTDVGQADCLSLAGGSVSGVTRIWVKGYVPDKGVAFHSQGLVIVDMNGGQTDGTHFILDETSPGYEPDAPFGGGIRADEMFTMHLLYDASTQSYRLMGVPDRRVELLGALPLAAHNLWRTAESTSLARQLELRSNRAGGGLWLKAAESETEHDTAFGFSLLGNHDELAFGYDQKDRAVSLGVDGTSEGEDWRYNMGISLGQVTSRLSIDNRGATADVDAISVALYGSYQRGRWFLDFSGSGYSGDLSGNLVLSQSSYPILASVTAVGGRTEAGYRLALGQSLAIEPLLSLVYVRSGIGDVQHLPGNRNNGVVFGSTESLRAGAGARLDFERHLQSSLRFTASLAARAWEELKGDVDAAVRTIRDPFPFAGGLDGRFTEVDAAVGLGSGAGMLYLSYTGQFGDDYDRKTALAGFRYSW